MQLMTFSELVRGWDASVPENYSMLLVSDVPTNLHQLIPYAQVFGISDDGYRCDLVRRVPPEIAEHLQAVVLEHQYEALMSWLVAPSTEQPNDARASFTALLMAADEVSVVLRRT